MYNEHSITTKISNRYPPGSFLKFTGGKIGSVAKGREG